MPCPALNWVEICNIAALAGAVSRLAVRKRMGGESGRPPPPHAPASSFPFTYAADWDLPGLAVLRWHASTPLQWAIPLQGGGSGWQLPSWSPYFPMRRARGIASLVNASFESARSACGTALEVVISSLLADHWPQMITSPALQPAGEHGRLVLCLLTGPVSWMTALRRHGCPFSHFT